jgi:phosphotransferase system  glucose/maltose/N-acetylglucosamine-specific IIC component
LAQEQGGTSSLDGTREKQDEMSTAQQKPASGATGLSQRPAKRPNWLADRVQDFAGDQKQIWTSPEKLRFSDTVWLVPLSGFAAGLFVTDADTSKHLSRDPQTQSHYTTISNAGIAAMAGGAGLMWAFSYKNHDSHRRETGFLAGEAALNSLLITEAAKYSFRRDRWLGKLFSEWNFLSFRACRRCLVDRQRDSARVPRAADQASGVRSRRASQLFAY